MYCSRIVPLLVTLILQLSASATDTNNVTLSGIFPDLDGITKDPNPGIPLSLGGQDFDHCCSRAVYESLQIEDGLVTGLRDPSFIGDNLTAFRNRQYPCGAVYIGERGGAPLVRIPYHWCRNNCRGWQISKNSKLNQWISPFVGFLVPAIVFCLAIPRRRKLAIPDLLFDIALNEVTSHFRTPWIILSAAILVTIDTISWLMTIFALSGPILVSGVYEASIDAQILAFLQEKIRNKRLSTIQRSRLLYTVLVGNIDMLNVPFGDQIDNTALCHIDGLLKKLQVREIEYKYHHIVMNGSIDKGTNTRQDLLKAQGKAVQKTKTRLRAMLATQYSFGVTVGAPVIFFCGSFIYTLVDNYSKLGDSNTSHALAFGMWWMIVPHIAIVSGLLLAGNNPNTLEGVVGQPTAKPQVPHRRFFELVYESRYTPTWIWQRGRSKKIWIERIGYDKASAPEGLEAKLRMNLSSWMVVGFLAYSLILIPSVLAFLTAFYTPTVGLSCRSMTVLLYMLCQLHLTVLWMWDIHSTYLDEHGVPHTPVTRIPWLRGGFRQNWEACVWWPLVITGSAGAIFSAIGGTMMQIMGVYRNCLCQLSIGDWRPLAYDATFVISTNSAEAIEKAATWWKGTGASAVGYLAFISYVGWWYQRRLRHQFKLLVNSIDESAEDP